MRDYPKGSYLTAKIEIPWHPGHQMEIKVLGTSYHETHRRDITQVESLNGKDIFWQSTGYTDSYYRSSTTEVFTDKIIEVIVRDVDGNEIDNLGKPPGKDVLSDRGCFEIAHIEAETSYDWEDPKQNPYLLDGQELEAIQEWMEA